MLPENPEMLETGCDSRGLVVAESNDRRWNGELETVSQEQEGNSKEFGQQRLQSVASNGMPRSISRKSSKNVAVSILSETPTKDQLLIFTVIDEKMTNYPSLPGSMSESGPKEEKQICCLFANRTRHIVLIIGTFCLLMILSNILILNVTIVCMTTPREPSSAEELSILSTLSTNDTVEEHNRTAQFKARPEFTYSPMVRTSLFATMASGSVLTVPVAVYLVKRLGAHRAFLIAGVLSAVSTALLPAAAFSGTGPFIIIRIGQGMPLAFCLPIVGSISAAWSTLKYSGIFAAIITSFVQLAPAFTMPMAGIICTSSLGWPAVYYIHAAVTVALFTLWAVIYKDKPHSQQFVSKKELDKITSGKPPQLPSQRVPILAIFTSSANWAIWLASFANLAGMQLFVIFMPAYMHKILGLPLKTASILAVLPPLCQLVVKLLAVGLSDHVKFISKLSHTTKLRLFNSISSLGGGLLLVILACVPTNNLFLSLVFLISSAGMLGFNTSGVFRSTPLVAKQHAYFVMGVVHFIYCFVLLIIPFAIDFLSAKRPNKDWSLFFITIAFLLVVTNIFFCAYGKGSAAKWTEISNSKSINKVTSAEARIF